RPDHTTPMRRPRRERRAGASGVRVESTPRVAEGRTRSAERVSRTRSGDGARATVPSPCRACMTSARAQWFSIPTYPAHKETTMPDLHTVLANLDKKLGYTEGHSIAIPQGLDLEYTTGSGQARVGPDVAMTSLIRMDVLSMSKTITAAGVVRQL